MEHITKEELAMQIPRIHYCKGCDARIVVCLLPDQPYILLACKCGYVAVCRAEEAENGQ